MINRKLFFAPLLLTLSPLALAKGLKPVTEAELKHMESLA